MKKSVTIFFSFLFLCGQSHANESAKADYIGAEILSAYEAVGKLPSLEMGLEMSMNDGWYTYWRMPGDNGLAPAFDWKDSVNVEKVDISWPAPSRFSLAGMHSFGYSGKTLLPLTVTPKEKGKDVTLALTFDTVVCHDICVPQKLVLSKTIPAGGVIQSAAFSKLAAAKKKLPALENTKTLGIDTAVLGKEAVVVTAYAKGGFAQGADMIVETPHSILTAPPEIIPDDKDGTRAIFKIKAAPGVDLSKELFGKDIAIVLVKGHEAVERKFSF